MKEYDEPEARSTPGARLRMLMQHGKIVVAPGVFNGLSARVAALTDFSCLYMSGSATAASMGLPDVGLVSLDEMVRRAEEVTAACDVPVLCDADSGYGNAVSVVQTVKRFERVGVAGIHLEDQVTTKKCGVLEGKALVSVQEMVGKLRAALDTRRDPSFVIIARTDAATVEGADAALERAAAYQDAGADGLFIHGIEDPDLFARIPAMFRVPVMTSNSGTGMLPTYRVEDLKRMGYKLVVFSTGAIYAAIHSMKRFYGEIQAQGAQEGVLTEMCDFDVFRHVVRLDAVDEVERAYGAGMP